MEWRTLDGFRYPVRVSDRGKVQKQLPNGEWITRNPYHARGQWRIDLYLANGKRKTFAVSKLVADAFLGGTPPGMCRVHKNRMKHDNAVENIIFLSHSDAAKWQRPARSQPVAKVDKDGNVVAVYKSQKEAAEKNYMSAYAMWYRCHGQTKKTASPDGYNYVFA